MTFFRKKLILKNLITLLYFNNGGDCATQTRGTYSNMIWVGTCCWDLKRRPIFIPNFTEKWDPFLYQSHIFYANFTKNFTLFSKIVKFSSKFKKFWYQIDEIGPIFTPILDNFENMTHVQVFALNKVSSLWHLSNFISFRKPTYATHSSHDSTLLFIPRTRTRTADNAFQVAGPRLWNSLPTNMRQAKSLDIFKGQLETHLFN